MYIYNINMITTKIQQYGDYKTKCTVIPTAIAKLLILEKGTIFQWDVKDNDQIVLNIIRDPMFDHPTYAKKIEK